MSYIDFEEFLRISNITKEKAMQLIAEGAIISKNENEKIYIDISSGANALIKSVENGLMSADMTNQTLSPLYVEKTIGTIMALNKKLLESKEETIVACKDENLFLKDTLVSMQEIYSDERKTMRSLVEQLQSAREEVEFMKRKYKLMWGKVANMAAKDYKD